MQAESTAANQTCETRSLFGWSPAPLPADTQVKRLVDRWMPRTGWSLCVFYAVIVGLLLLAPSFPRRPELALEGLAAFGAGLWCGLNFWRCRHAHCLITSTGWLALSLFAFGEAALGRTLIRGFEQPVFIAILVLGIGFEWAWSHARGTNAVGGGLPA